MPLFESVNRFLKCDSARRQAPSLNIGYINVKIEEHRGDCQFGAVPGALIDCLLILDYGFIKHVLEGFVPHFELVYIIGTICMHSN